MSKTNRRGKKKGIEKIEDIMDKLEINQIIEINNQKFQVIGKDTFRDEKLNQKDNDNNKEYFKYILLDSSKKYVYWLVINEENSQNEYYMFNHFTDDADDYEYADLENKIVSRILDIKELSLISSMILVSLKIAEIDTGEIILFENRYTIKKIGYGKKVPREEVNILNEFEIEENQNISCISYIIRLVAIIIALFIGINIVIDLCERFYNGII